MSLRGRYVIDRMKQAVGNYIRFPVPPYGQPTYWDGVYRQLGPEDVFEWGHVSFEDLKEFEYSLLNNSLLQFTRSASPDGMRLRTNLGESIGILPNEGDDRPILMLGCGNSTLGEDMIRAGWKGPVIQVDVSSRVIDSMSHRCSKLIVTGDMQLIQDDATVLSAASDNSASAVVDKGLLDALFCADQLSQCSSVMHAVHRVLQPLGVFCFLSFSYPEFLFQHLVIDERRKKLTRMWRDVQIRLIEDKILLYRFQKVGADTIVSSQRSITRRPNRR